MTGHPCRTIFLFVLAVFVFLETRVFASEDSFTFKGYYKNLLERSETPSSQEYFSDFNRLRFELNDEFAKDLRGELTLDNEWTFGSVLKTDAFKTQKDKEQQTFLDLDRVVSDTSDVFYRVSAYRASLIYSYNAGEMIAGRQRVAWGTGKFWNPTDLFNPYNPLTLEREERPGVDALRLEYSTGPLSRVVGVYAPGRAGNKDKGALKYRSNLHEYDFSLMAGTFSGAQVVGADFSGSIGDAGIHGEGVYRVNSTQGHSGSFVLGGEYTFPNSLYLLLEYYYNGEGRTNPLEYDIPRLLAGEIVSLGREYLGASVGYDFTGILRGDIYGIYNTRDRSLFIQPVMRYSIAASVDWSVGAQFFTGSIRSEFGQLKNLYYTQLQWFF